MNTNAMKDREKIFKQYRATKVALKKALKDYHKANTIYDKLSEQVDYLKRLVNVMVEYDCDSVEAKLKYEKKLKVDHDDDDDDEMEDAEIC